MVLSSSQRLHTRPSHLHCDAHHFPPDQHHQHLHPPDLHPPLHVDRPVPDLLLRDVVQAPDQVLGSSSSGHGEAERLSVSLSYHIELLLLLLQSSSGVFVCLLESLQQLWTVEPKLLSIYYLIFVLAAYLASFDLHYALPVMVRLSSGPGSENFSERDLAGFLPELHPHMSPPETRQQIKLVSLLAALARHSSVYHHGHIFHDLPINIQR